MLIMKSRERQITGGIELPNQERAKTFGEKENYKYLVILESATVTRKNKKRVPIDERKSFLKPNFATGFSSKR